MADFPETSDLTEAEAAQNTRDGYTLAVAAKRIEVLEAEIERLRNENMMLLGQVNELSSRVR